MKLSMSLETKIKSLGLGEPSRIEGINHFDFSSLPLQISYIKKDKESLFNGDFYNIDLRKKFATTAKAGKILRKFFPNVKDDVLRNKVPILFGGEGDDLFKDFEISTKIRTTYHKDSYETSKGTLGNSCMRYDECQEQLEFYEKVGVKILILKGNDGIKGRALVWENCLFRKNEEDEGIIITFMDRIYTNNDADVELFKEYAKSKDWFRKVSQDYDETKEFYDGSGYKVKGVISYKTNLKLEFYDENQMKLGSIKKFPFIDTLMNFGVDGSLNSYAPKREYKVGTMQNTNGVPSIHNYINRFGDLIGRCDAFWSELYKCYIDNTKTVFSRYHDANIRKESSRKIFFKGEIDNIDMTLIPKKNIIIHNGKERLSEEIFKCHDGKMVAIEECEFHKTILSRIEEKEKNIFHEWTEYKKKNWSENRLKIDKEHRHMIDMFIPTEFPDFIYPCGTNLFREVMKDDDEDSLHFIKRIKEVENIYLIFNNEDKIIQVGIPRSV